MNLPSKKPHILIVPSEYVTPMTPHGGIFVQIQGRALVKEGAKVGVIYPHLRGVPGLLQGKCEKGF